MSDRPKLYAFSVHDDPEGNYPEECWWSCIAAENEEQAKLIAAATYIGDGPLNEIPWREFFEVAHKIDMADWPEHIRPTNPEVLHDLEAQRLCGFREDGEQTCDSCGLAAMGMKQYRVCGECGQCAECGCDCLKGKQ